MNEQPNNLSNEEQAASEKADPTPHEYIPMTPPQKKNDALGIVAIVTGIASVVCCCCIGYISIALGIAGLVCALLSRSKIGKFSGIAITGLICGIVGILLGVSSVALDVILRQPETMDMLIDWLEQNGVEIPPELLSGENTTIG